MQCAVLIALAAMAVAVPVPSDSPAAAAAAALLAYADEAGSAVDAAEAVSTADATETTKLADGDRAALESLDGLLIALDELPPRPVQEERSDRHPRATCDLLSFLGMEHTLCALHCRALKPYFVGGYCKDGVCHCRK